jgi:hypothetical protein
MGRFSILLILFFFASACVPSQTREKGTNDLKAEVKNVGPRKIELLPSGRPPQFVVLSIDGAGDQAMVQELITTAKAVDARLTLFLSGVYFVTIETGKYYLPPRMAAGTSDIGFNYEGDGMTGSQYVGALIDKVIAARDSGFELATHYNGHFCGKINNWNDADWQKELDEYFKLVNRSNEFVKHGNTKLNIARESVKGSRTPCLEGNKSVLRAFAKRNGFTYDASTTGSMTAWPKKIDGIWDFPLVSIPIWDAKTKAFSAGPVLSMDYNLYYWRNGGVTITDQALLKEVEDSTFKSYVNYYKVNYHGTRAPVSIGTHTSKFHSGSYWRALLRLMKEVCTQPETVCGTYEELANFMEANPNIGSGNWPKLPKNVLGLAEDVIEAAGAPKEDAVPSPTCPEGEHNEREIF